MKDEDTRKARHEHDAHAKGIGGVPGACILCGQLVGHPDASDEWCEECSDALFEDDGAEDFREEWDDEERCDHCGRCECVCDEYDDEW